MNRITPEEIKRDPFTLIDKDWMLITAEKEGKVNTMTASWGGVGIIWNKKVAYIFIRPQRYTKEFVDASERFSLSVLPDSYRKELTYLGRVSGRDEDKIAKTGLKVAYEEGVPYFEESKYVLICRKLYAQDLKGECFIDKSLDPKNYPTKDYHTMYVAEIEEVLEA
ncbi:MAG: flavin reductase family protein [Clostridia bacterium]|nr:flavin reductase family protein [Clostridia bacterium]